MYYVNNDKKQIHTYQTKLEYLGYSTINFRATDVLFLKSKFNTSKIYLASPKKNYYYSLLSNSIEIFMLGTLKKNYIKFCSIVNYIHDSALTFL